MMTDLSSPMRKSTALKMASGAVGDGVVDEAVLVVAASNPPLTAGSLRSLLASAAWAATVSLCHACNDGGIPGRGVGAGRRSAVRRRGTVDVDVDVDGRVFPETGALHMVDAGLRVVRGRPG